MTKLSDRERYQTVFAREEGAIAAPTAGLHFTPELLDKIPHAFLTLHVGVGTFRPVSVEVVADHIMHSERYAVSAETARRVNAAGRVVAVGTTVTRVLEAIGARSAERGVRMEEKDHAGETDIFIHPPYDFRVVGGLADEFPPAAKHADHAGERVCRAGTGVGGLPEGGGRALPFLQLRRLHVINLKVHRKWCRFPGVPFLSDVSEISAPFPWVFIAVDASRRLTGRRG